MFPASYCRAFAQLCCSLCDDHPFRLSAYQRQNDRFHRSGFKTLRYPSLLEKLSNIALKLNPLKIKVRT
jgi:hypothetical protein